MRHITQSLKMIIALLLVGILCPCAQGESIRVLTNSACKNEKAAQRFEKDTGTTVVFDVISAELIWEQLYLSVLFNEPYDLVYLEEEDLEKNLSKNLLQPVDEFLKPFEKEYVWNTESMERFSVNGFRYGLCGNSADNVLVLQYRKDLLERAGVQSMPDELYRAHQWNRAAFLSLLETLERQGINYEPASVEKFENGTSALLVCRAFDVSFAFGKAMCVPLPADEGILMGKPWAFALPVNASQPDKAVHFAYYMLDYEASRWHDGRLQAILDAASGEILRAVNPDEAITLDCAQIQSLWTK